jgi:hypothetical protein
MNEDSSSGSSIWMPIKRGSVTPGAIAHLSLVRRSGNSGHSENNDGIETDSHTRSLTGIKPRRQSYYKSYTEQEKSISMPATPLNKPLPSYFDKAENEEPFDEETEEENARLKEEQELVLLMNSKLKPVGSKPNVKEIDKLIGLRRGSSLMQWLNDTVKEGK